MQFIGKLVGGLLGFLMAGGFGALLGVFIGNYFDRGLKHHLHQANQPFFQETRPQVLSAFLKAAACLMGLLAKADGRVSESEINFANQIFSNFKIKNKDLETAQQWFTASKNGQVSLQDHIRMLQYLKDMNINLCKKSLDIAYQMARVDGLNGEKINLMNQILSSIGFVQLDSIFNAEEFWQNIFSEQLHRQQQGRQYRSQYRAPRPQTLSLSDAFSTLALQPNATQAEVKKAYRKLMSKYHPDKMIAKGASKTELKTATEKTQQVSKAYTLICESKGWD
jgi:DnaJ like chaperone protein